MAITGGPLTAVKVISAADLSENGGSYHLARVPARPVYAFSGAPRAVVHQRAVAVYVVDASYAGGFEGSGAEPLYIVDSDAPSPLRSEEAIPVYVVAGSLSLNQRLLSASISGVSVASTFASVTLTASAAPANATPPLVYRWQATGLADRYGSSASFVWSTEGAKTVTLTVSNAFGAVQATHSVFAADWFYDGFSGANGASLANRAPEVRPLANAWFITNGTVHIQDNQARPIHTSQGAGGAAYNCGLANVSGTVYFTLPTGAPVAGFVVRASDTSNYIRFIYNQSSTSLRMHRVVAGVQQAADATAVVTGGLTVGVKHRLDFYVDGALWSLSLNGGTPLTYNGANASFNQNATSFGIYGTQTVGGQGVDFDDFTLHPRADVIVQPAAAPSVTSRFVPGVQFVNTPDAGQKSSWNCDGWSNMRTNLLPVTGMYSTRIYPGGLGEPWVWDGTGERDAEPNNLYGEQGSGTVESPANNSLAYALTVFRGMSSTAPIMISMQGFPWWQKGRLQSNGTTVPCAYPADQWTDEGRVMQSRMDDWYTLCRAVAILALAEPHHVRYFCFGSELQGYWNPKTAGNGGNKWDVQYSAGTPGDNADGGASYTYKLMTDAVLSAASELGIARSEIHLGGLYCIAATRQTYSAGVTVGAGHPLYNQTWGHGDLDWCDAQEDFLDIVVAQNLPLDFMCVDGRTWHVGGVAPTTEDWANAAKWSDFYAYYRTLLSERGLDPDMEIIYPEFYATPNVDLKSAPTSYNDATDQAARAALRAEAMRRMVLGRVSYACTWGPSAQAWTPGTEANSALITSPATAGGGQKGPAHAAVKIFVDYFGPGTAIYESTLTGTGVCPPILSPSKALLINQTNAAKTVWIRGTKSVVSLAAYGVVAADR